MSIKIDTLIIKSKDVLKNSYSKYSNFKVGASVLGDNGKVYVGTNIENSSYGLTICAERVAIFSAVSDGVKLINKLVLTSEEDNYITPCGACRQVLSEFSNKYTEIILVNKKGEFIIKTVEELLPLAFKI
ncbi:MAG: cytidine deaminase [Fusobacteria bacterium]|nr:cytidine deaminase [Fusobacteriota bacterium]